MRAMSLPSSTQNPRLGSEAQTLRVFYTMVHRGREDLGRVAQVCPVVFDVFREMSQKFRDESSTFSFPLSLLMSESKIFQKLGKPLLRAPNPQTDSWNNIDQHRVNTFEGF